MLQVCNRPSDAQLLLQASDGADQMDDALGKEVDDRLVEGGGRCRVVMLATGAGGTRQLATGTVTAIAQMVETEERGRVFIRPLQRTQRAEGTEGYSVAPATASRKRAKASNSA